MLNLFETVIGETLGWASRFIYLISLAAILFLGYAFAATAFGQVPAVFLTIAFFIYLRR